MKVVLLTLLVVALHYASADTDCPPFCPLLWAPICAKNKDGLMHTYDNPCLMKSVNCKDKLALWEEISKGPCPQALSAKDCGVPCTREMNPCCAINKNGELKVFSNRCVFGNAQKCTDEGWTLIGGGQCKLYEKYIPCPGKKRICTKEFKPVCGESADGTKHTFSNICMFANEYCEHPKAQWTVINQYAACE